MFCASETMSRPMASEPILPSLVKSEFLPTTILPLSKYHSAAKLLSPFGPIIKPLDNRMTSIHQFFLLLHLLCGYLHLSNRNQKSYLLTGSGTNIPRFISLSSSGKNSCTLWALFLLMPCNKINKSIMVVPSHGRVMRKYNDVIIYACCLWWFDLEVVAQMHQELYGKVCQISCTPVLNFKRIKDRCIRFIQCWININEIFHPGFRV